VTDTLKLISVTITGNAEAVIGDALASVIGWVDACLVVDTGVTDRTLEVAASVAGDKLVLRHFPWVDDFAAARNFALDAAHDLEADWACIVDTDERLEPRGEDLRARLAATRVNHLLTFHAGRTYQKARFFRLPAVGRFRGATHEVYPAHALGAETLDRCVFWEEAKTPEQLRAKFVRDARLLGAMTLEHPTEPRWHYYLGDTLQNLGYLEAAIVAYRQCSELRGWDEEAAWACYRCAECHCAREQWQAVVDVCAEGLARHGGIAELAWLAGFASLKLGRALHAVGWARSAIALGDYRGAGPSFGRIYFRHVPALWEGPFDVLRFALRALGDEAGADEADRLCIDARAARVAAALV